MGGMAGTKNDMYTTFNNNNRLFMAPHFVRVLSSYKGPLMPAFHHARNITFVSIKIFISTARSQ